MAQITELLVHFDDRDYTFDLDEMTRSEAGYIKRHTGMTPLQVQTLLEQADPDASAAVYWLMLKQNGKVTDIDRLDFKIAKFSMALSEAVEERRKKNEELGESEDPKLS